MEADIRLLQNSCSWNLTLNSIDRVVLITMPNHLLFMRKIKFQMLAMFTVVRTLTVITVPNLIFTKLIVYSGELICNISYSSDLFYYNMACAIIYLALPFFIMLTCPILIIFKMKELRNSLNANEQRRRRDYVLAKTVLRRLSAQQTTNIAINLRPI
jgi:hypothetical protein